MSCRTQYRIQKRNEKQTMYETCGLGSNSKQKRKASDTHFRKCFMHPFACQTHTCLTYIHLYAYKYRYIYSFMCVCLKRTYVNTNSRWGRRNPNFRNCIHILHSTVHGLGPSHHSDLGHHDSLFWRYNGITIILQYGYMMQLLTRKSINLIGGLDRQLSGFQVLSSTLVLHFEVSGTCFALHLA